MTQNAAEFIQQNKLDNRFIVIVPDYISQSVAAHIPHAKIYKVLSTKTNKINDWELSFTKAIEHYVYEMNNQDRLNLIPQDFIQTNRPLIIIGQDAGPTGIIGGLEYRKIASFTGGIVMDEDCYIYDVVQK
jgi:hypothetical protein